ncbi:MAG: phosphatidylserine decarboxylase [Archaeoglobaceae archaeon]
MIEKSAYPMLAISALIAIVLIPVYLPISLFFIFFAIFTAYFFRDPERKIEDGVVSPADGKIDVVHGNKLEIFMSPFDCHVNRAPVRGEVLRIIFHEGKLIPAYKKQKGVRMNEITIKAEDGIFKVVQVAGIFARRIVCYLREGERVEKGAKIGLIRFGSRVILEIPEGYRFIRKKGEKIKAGETVAVKNEDIS